jgi:hypothetical protein
VEVGQLSDDDAELVMNACSERGHFFYPRRTFGQRFSFMREIDVDRSTGRPFAWDEEGVLWDCLSLSRLVRDNAFSTAYAARIVDHEDGEQQVIYTPNAESKHAYRFRQDRDWLDVEEAGTLCQLAEAYWSCEDDLPRRVRQAMWRTEYSCWLRWGDLALPIIVAGLESLLKTERHRATAQFVGRVPAMAEELGVGRITAELCADVYDARSEWVHGTHVRLFSTGKEAELGQAGGPETPPQADAFATIALFQDVLRAAVRRAVQDAAFRTTFEDDSAIAARWPLAPRPV